MGNGKERGRNPGGVGARKLHSAFKVEMEEVMSEQNKQAGPTVEAAQNFLRFVQDWLEQQERQPVVLETTAETSTKELVTA